MVTICTFDNPNEYMAYSAKEKVGFISQVQSPFLYLYNYFLYGKDSVKSASDFLKNTTVPTMIIEASNDETIPKQCGIISHCSNFQNKNIIKNTITTDRLNSHNTIWLSETTKSDNKTSLNINFSFFDKILNFYNNSIAVK